jgi:hypothetical protein
MWGELWHLMEVAAASVQQASEIISVIGLAYLCGLTKEHFQQLF